MVQTCPPEEHGNTTHLGVGRQTVSQVLLGQDTNRTTTSWATTERMQQHGQKQGQQAPHINITSAKHAHSNTTRATGVLCISSSSSSSDNEWSPEDNPFGPIDHSRPPQPWLPAGALTPAEQKRRRLHRQQQGNPAHIAWRPCQQWDAPRSTQLRWKPGALGIPGHGCDSSNDTNN